MNLKTFIFLVLTVDHYFGAKILFKYIYIYMYLLQVTFVFDY